MHADFIQQPYGVTLNFTPVVLSQGRIQLQDRHRGDRHRLLRQQITFAGISVPGFRTRKNDDHGRIAFGRLDRLGRLDQTQTQQAINGFPGLMNLPVLGALFRSRDYQRNETELLIVVTPYIVHAVDPQRGRPAGPELSATPAIRRAGCSAASTGIYSSSESLQPMPGYSGKMGFITE